MVKTPTLAIFLCETCGAQSKTDERMGAHLLPWMRRLRIEPNGCCSKCSGGLWTISVIYTEESIDVGPTLVGMGLELATGVGFSKTTTDSNRSDYPNVSAAAVSLLNKDPRDRMRRISEFVQRKERETLIARGAKECRMCRALFMPVVGKAWSMKGYCSKACASENREAIPEAVESPARRDEAPYRPMIQVRCPGGHEFEVSLSFRGMVRACPQCGIKTRVDS